MTTENIRSASTVLSDFLGDQSKDEYLDQATVSAITSLRGDDKLTRISLLRQLEEARKASLKDETPREEG